MNGVLPVTTLSLCKFCFSLRISFKELIYIPTTQIPIFVHLKSARILFAGGFFFPVSILNRQKMQQH